MKRLGTIAIATLGLGFALSGFSNTASAAEATNCPLKTAAPIQMPQQAQWFQYMPQMKFAPQFGYQLPVQMQQPVQAPAKQPVQQQPAQQQPVQQAPAQQTPVAAVQPAKKAEQQVQASEVVKQVADLVNQERAKAGLKPVEMDASLNNVAQAKAADMSNNNYFDHTSPTYGSPFDMMKQFGVSFMTAGENIAMGQRTAEEVMNQWMNSEGHRQNIMNPSFTKIGVGYINGYWVQEFIG
ncbi:CAP domain-containing protein [Brevibacillus nitrificans]|uniref:CAP domain-containing protein n=1 Tax=Brevibacillus nitrificans TaxID=651560 RepID=UPI002614D43A|nr:CAP domain-containing protein [Brevibacillus nitrificans]